MKRIHVITLVGTLLVAGGVLLCLLPSGSDEPPASAPRVVEAEPDDGPPAEPDRESPVPGLIAALTDPSAHRTARIEAIRALPGDLTDEEFRAILEFMRRPLPERLGAGEWQLVVNELMNSLRMSPARLESYRAAMTAWVRDAGSDPVLRDYAAQHLMLSLGDETGHAGAESFRKVIDACLGVIADPDQSFEGVTGTILMALCELHDRASGDVLGPWRARLGREVLAMLGGRRPASMSNRISALQYAGRMDCAEALPAIRRVARDDSEKFAVRLSAVAALGYFDRKEDRAYLEELAAGDTRLVAAARTALDPSAAPR